MRDAMGWSAQYHPHGCDDAPVRTRRMGLSNSETHDRRQGRFVCSRPNLILPRRDDDEAFQPRPPLNALKVISV